MKKLYETPKVYCPAIVPALILSLGFWVALILWLIRIF